MGLRVRKSIKLGKHVKLNVGKNGVSTSIKVGNVTHNSKRGTTVNLGNGVSYHVPNSNNKKNNNANNNRNNNTNNNRNNCTNTRIDSNTTVEPQQRRKVKPSEFQCKAANFIVKAILYPISLFFILGFFVSLGSLNIASLFICFVIGIGSGIAAKKFDIRKFY